MEQYMVEVMQQCETMTTTQKSIKTMKENNTSHGIDDATIVSMETQINEWDLNDFRLLVNTL
jgi:hypothetical protein